MSGSTNFKVLQYIGNTSLSIGGRLTWNESDWMLPYGNPPNPQPWTLSSITLQGQPQQWGNLISWTTNCGYLEWDKDTATIKYKAEIDGCMKGCGRICKCNDKQDGTCFCGNNKFKTGYKSSYVYSTNSEACYFQDVVSAGTNRARDVMSVSVRYSKVTWPFTFGKYNSKECIPELAFDALRVKTIKLARLGADVGQDPETPLVVYGGAKYHKDVLDCDNGVYQLVMNVPYQPGRYACSIALNDGSPERRLGILKVLP
eukprot:gene2682-2983_t